MSSVTRSGRCTRQFSVGPSQLRVSKSLRTQSCAAQLTVSSQRRSQSVPVPIRPPSIVTLLTSGAKSKSEARFTSQAQSSSAMTTITCALWRPRTAQLREPWSTSCALHRATRCAPVLASAPSEIPSVFLEPPHASKYPCVDLATHTLCIHRLQAE